MLVLLSVKNEQVSMENLLWFVQKFPLVCAENLPALLAPRHSAAEDCELAVVFAVKLLLDNGLTEFFQAGGVH
jgi:hypothetical protein